MKNIFIRALLIFTFISLIGCEQVTVSPQTGAATYVLTFDNMRSGEMAEIEKFLELFSGYVDHRAISRASTETVLSYQSNISEPDLVQMLHKLLDEMQYRYVIKSEGNDITMKVIAR